MTLTTVNILDTLAANIFRTDEYTRFLATMEANPVFDDAFMTYRNEADSYVPAFLSTISARMDDYPLVIGAYMQAGILLANDPSLTLRAAFEAIAAQTRADSMPVVDHLRTLLRAVPKTFQETVITNVADIIMARTMGLPINLLSELASGLIASSVYAGWHMSRARMSDIAGTLLN
jgi:hypothetical protein